MEATLDTSELTDEELAAAAAREGSDGPAFVALIERFQDRVWRVCYRLLGNTDDASDAAQEVFVQLFVQRNQFEGRSKYSTWVHGIAARTCLMDRRTHGRRRKHEDEAKRRRENQAVPRTDVHSDIAMDVMQMLEMLDEEDRAMLIMKYSEGYSYDELAEMFELSVSACKMRVSRSRQRLQQRFPEHNFASSEE